MSQYSTPPSLPPGMPFPPTQPGMLGQSMPHRGVLVLVLGILGIIMCGVFGVIAWVMGNRDVNQMQVGRMDPSGRGLTDAGRICGIIGTVLLCLQVAALLIWLLFIVFVIAVAGATAAGGARGSP